MRKLFLFIVLATILPLTLSAKKHPEIKFETMNINLGKFSMDDPIRTCVFKFTNTGEAKLVITSAHASCGCTVPNYPKDYISPGATGEIKVTYNGTGKSLGRFKKSIQVFTNCKKEMVRLFIEGEMTDVSEPEQKEE